MASVDLTVTVDVAGVGHLTGRLQRTGPDWVLVADRDEEWLIRLAAVRSVAGLSSRSRPDIAWTPTQRLGIGSVLRRLADEAGECLLHTVAGSRHEVRLTRVGADFVEVVAGDRSLVVSLTHLAAVHSRG